jgi:hypothetical protein
MWFLRRKQPKHEEAGAKRKKWQYVRLQVEVGVVREDCFKKVKWCVPLSKRIDPFF